MNIQNNEISVLNKKFMRLRETNSESQSTPTTTALSETPETKPETEMAYLQAKANNNIAFQGLRTTLKPMEKAMSKMFIAALIAGSAMMASCSDEVEYIPSSQPITNTTNVTVNVDFSALIDFFNRMYEDQKITQEKYDQVIAYLKLLYEAQLAGNKQDAAFQETVIRMMMEDQATQEAILAQLVANGESQEAGNIVLTMIFDLIEKGDYANALKTISDILSGIENKVTVIASFEALLKQIALNTENLMTKEEAKEIIAILTEIYESQEAKNADDKQFKGMVAAALMDNAIMNRLIYGQLIKNGKSQEEANAKLEELKNGGAEALDEIKEILKSIDAKLSVITEWTAILNQIASNTENLMTKEEAKEIIAILTAMYESQEAKNASDEEFQSMVAEKLVTNEVLQKLIYEQLIKNGMTQEEANAKLEELKNGGAEALNEIKEILNSIDATVKDILVTVKEIFGKMVSNHDEYLKDRAQYAEYLKMMFEYEEKQTQLLSNINKTTTQMNAKLDSLRADIKDVQVILKDDTKFNELMDAIKDIKPGDVDYEKFEKMFLMVNTTIKEVSERARTDRETLRKDLLGAINNLENTIIKIGDKHSKQFTEISNKITLLIANFPKFDNEGIKESILELYLAIQDNTGAIDKNTDVIGGQLEDVNAKLDDVLKKLDTMIAQIGKASDEAAVRHQMYMQKWDETLSYVDKLIQKMAAGHTDIVEEIKSLENSQNIANARLTTLISKADDVIKLLNEFEVSGKEGMTIAELKAFMQERDAEQFNKFVQLLKDMGLDQLDENQAMIIDLIKAANLKLDNSKDYSNQLETIISLLKGMDKTSPDYSAQLKEIAELIKEWKCNCECGNNSSSNEGILGDLQNKLG